METLANADHFILVIDDDRAIREAICVILEEEGYRVAAATNGQEALDRLTGTELPCLILLDLMMPVMTGWEFVKQVRERGEPLAGIPICIVSAYADRAPPEAVAVLEKPIELDALLEVVGTRC